VRALGLIAAVLLVAGCGGGVERAVSTSTVPSAANPHPAAGTFEPDGTTIEQCKGDTACLEQAFGNLAYYEGPKAALARFDAQMKTDHALAANCHRTAHVIGAGALARYKEVSKAFAEGSASCWSGYYHGILERAFQDVPFRERELAEKSVDLCDDASIRRVTWIAYQCVHGLGHGLMIYTGYNLPFALGVCDRLTTDWDKTSCHGGVFMENIDSSYGVKSKWLRDDDPVYPCRDVQEQHKLYCYLMVTSRTLQLNGYDFDQTAATCKTVEKDWVETCFNSMGRDASGQSTQSPKRVVELCSKAGRDYWDDCIWGAARDMAATFSNGERASELCLLLPETMRSTCFWQVGTILGTMSPTADGRRQLCAPAPKRYLGDCVAGASA
jgi:hypothetical protein